MVKNFNLVKIFVWTTLATVVKNGVALIVNKLLAIYFGPQGVGRSGNFITLLHTLTALSGGGISDGINKYTAELSHDSIRLRELLGTASFVSLAFSVLLAVILILGRTQITSLVFDSSEFKYIILLFTCIQCMFAYSYLLRAILKGRGYAISHALCVIIGALIGITFYTILIHYYGYHGALIGLAFMPAWNFFPAAILFYQNTKITWKWFIPVCHLDLVSKLFKFSFMSLSALVVSLLTYAILKSLLVSHCGIVEIGLWEAIRKLSGSYFQITTSFVSSYLIPKLSNLKNNKQIRQKIFYTFYFLVTLFAGISIVIWILRDWLITLCFSEKFLGMRDLLAWQLCGDVLRISSAVFTGFILSKALLKFYLISEIILLILLASTAYWFIPSHGVLGAAQAHLTAHLIYFMILGSVIFIHCKYKNIFILKE